MEPLPSEPPASELVSDAPAIAPPLDRRNTVYVIFYLLGIGLLLPWNAVISSVDYIDLRFPGQHHEFLFSALYMYTLFVGIVVLVFGTARKWRWIERFAVKWRIMTGLGVYTVALLVIPYGGLWVICSCVVAIGFGDAIMQGSLYGLAGNFPPRYTQAVQSGTALSGVVTATLRLTTKGSLSTTDIKTSAIVYFVLAGVVVLVCIVIYGGYFYRLSFVQYYLTMGAGSPDHTEVALVRGVQDEADDAGTPSMTMKEVLRAIKVPAVSVFLSYTVTLTVFPGILTEIELDGVPKHWLSVILLAIFQITDFIGKTAPYFIRVGTPRAILWASVGRLAFIPLLAMCVSTVNIIREPALVYTIVVLMGLTNGYVGALSMMAGPTCVPAAAGEMAGMLMAFALMIGLTVGVTLGWIFSAIFIQ